MHCGLNACPLQPTIHMLKLKVPVWWYLEVGPLGGNYFMRVEPSWMRLVPLQEDAWERCLTSTNQEKGPHQSVGLLAPWPWTSQSLQLWEIHFCCLSHPVYGIDIFLWWLSKLRHSLTLSEELHSKAFCFRPWHNSLCSAQIHCRTGSEKRRGKCLGSVTR